MESREIICGRKTMNRSVLWLRAASVLTLIHAALHTIGGVFGKPGPGPATVAVEAMKSNPFVWMGNTRSYWDFYIGFGLGISIFLTLDAIVLWLLASLARTDATRLRPILLAYALGYLAFAVNSYVYFFLGAVITEILIVLCIASALLAARPAREPATA
jgi:hypothetical protein